MSAEDARKYLRAKAFNSARITAGLTVEALDAVWAGARRETFTELAGMAFDAATKLVNGDPFAPTDTKPAEPAAPEVPDGG